MGLIVAGVGNAGDVNVYSATGTASLVSDPPSPWGHRSIRITGVQSADVLGKPVTAPTLGTYVWYMALCRFTAVPSNGQRQGILNIPTDGASPRDNVGIHWYGQASGNPKIAYLDNTLSVIGQSTNTFFPNRWYRVIVRFDGTNVRLWVDGVAEFTIAGTEKPVAGLIQWQAGGSSASNTRYISDCIVYTSSTVGDINEASAWPEVRSHYPNANGFHDDYGRLNACSTQGDGDYTYWDDWLNGGLGNGDGDYNCGMTLKAWEQSSGITSATYVNPLKRVMWVGRLRVLDAGKFVPHTALIRYSGTDKEVDLGSFGTATYFTLRNAYDLAPGEIAWTQAILNASEAGHTRNIPADDDTRIFVTAICLEGAAWGPTAPPGLVVPRYPMRAMIGR